MSKTTSSTISRARQPRKMARPPEAAVTAIPVSESTPSEDPVSNASAASRSPSPTKASIVLDLLRREGGATLPELVEATGWQPHTTRAHLTGLRKKGHTIERTRRDDAPCYRVVEAG